MRKGDRRPIKVGHKQFEAEYLGKGRHATAYRAGNTVYLFVHDEGEYMKEAVEMWCDDMPHIPKIESHGEQLQRGKYVKVYSMPYYPNVTARDSEAWAILKMLSEAADRVHREKYIRESKPLALHGLYFMNDVIEDTRGKVPVSVTEALTELMSAGSNYGSGVTCEFGKRNIGVDDQGRIVFRDILFDAEKMQRELNERRRAAHRY